MTTSSNSGYSPGTFITGKWQGNHYVIQRVLGKGANGVVYLVQRPEDQACFALKMGFDSLDLQSEINVLRTLQEHRSDPYLIEADDYTDDGSDIPFYVMRYIEGSPLHRFIQGRGREWLGLVGLKLLEKLSSLHRSGWVFGDLKPENVMVSPYGQVELIDFGGVSAAGRSVKQFTEWYDRGYWNAGSRTGDAGYDLFAFAVICIHLLDESVLRTAAGQLPQIRNVSDLQQAARTSPRLKPFAGWIIRAVNGEFKDTTEALRLWRDTIYAPSRKIAAARKPTPQWLRNSFVLSLVLLGFAVYWLIRF